MPAINEQCFASALRRFAARYRARLSEAWRQPCDVSGPGRPFLVDERSQGLYATWPPQSDLGGATSIRRIKMTPDKGRAIADAYSSAWHRPDDPLVAASYGQMIAEMYTQYLFATEQLGIKIEPFKGSGEPYESSRAMRWDVLANRHLYVLRTDHAFGTHPREPGLNWMQMPTDLVMPGGRLLVNDLFRAVHDLFAHAFPGTTFGPNGEERAWFVHSRMCTALARPALTSETRGQNCWVNFGPHMRRSDGSHRQEGEPGWLAQAERPFAAQKNALLPPRMSGVRLQRDRRGRVFATALADWSPQSFARPQSASAVA